MAIRPWKCAKCDTIEDFFDNEEKICVCGHTNFEKQIAVPLKAKTTDKVDRYHNVDMEKGIEEDLRKRNRRHALIDTADDFIEEFGVKAAKEAGILIWDPKLKEWRKREPWELGLQGSKNSASLKDGQ